MPQGKIKVKAQMPSSVKGKKVKKLDKAPPQRKVKNNPIGPKKLKKMEVDKMKKTISKTINKTLEERLIAQVGQDGKPLSVIGRKEAAASQSSKGKK